MAKQRRVLAKQRGEAGRAVTFPDSRSAGRVATLTADEAELLDEDLRAIDRAQQDALASGTRYLGSRP